MDFREPFRNGRRREVALGGAGFVGAFLIALLWPAKPAVEQPLRYNHQKHIEAGAQCADCHTLYSSSPWAGIPTIEMCTTCHQEALTESGEEKKLLDLAKQGKPLDWKQVNRLATHVYFSHQTHAVSAEIQCAVCHGAMEKRTVPPTEPLFAWTMDACMNCHEQKNATVDCNGCHR